VYRCRLSDEDEGERGFRMAVLVQRPARFRLELYGAVGGPRLLVASDGTLLDAAMPGERMHASAPATAEAFRTLLGVSVDGAALLDLLTGAGSDAAGPVSDGFQIAYGETEATPAGPLPSEVQLAREGRSLTLRLRHAEPRSGVGPDAFRLPVPAGFRGVPLEAIAGAGGILFAPPEDGSGGGEEPPSARVPGVDTSPQLQ
jgi:hypothetical protein